MMVWGSSVLSGSNAYRAGIRISDIFSELRYEEGRASVPVRGMVQRAHGRGESVLFYPKGRTKQGRQFERDPGAREAECRSLP